MRKPITLTAQDSLIEQLAFKPFRSAVERRAAQYQPSDPTHTLDVNTPWGETLTAEKGDYLVC